MLPAIKAIMENPAFAWGTDVQNKVIGATGRMISNSTVDPDIVNRLTGLVRSFVDRVDALSDDYEASMRSTSAEGCRLCAHVAHG